MGEAYWNEVCRILNEEFVSNGQELTPVLLRQLMQAVKEVLTD